THLVAVGYSTPDKALSARIANAHVKAYIRRGIDLHAQASSAAQDFLQKKLLDLKERVEKSEAALNAYRRDRGIVTFSLHDTSDYATSDGPQQLSDPGRNRAHRAGRAASAYPEGRLRLAAGSHQQLSDSKTEGGDLDPARRVRRDAQPVQSGLSSAG